MRLVKLFMVASIAGYFFWMMNTQTNSVWRMPVNGRGFATSTDCQKVASDYAAAIQVHASPMASPSLVVIPDCNYEEASSEVDMFN